MTVYLVGAGPGDPGLVTVRAAELLRRADVVIYDRLSVAELVELAPADAERVPVGKTPGGPSTPQAEINALLIAHGRAGRVVVRLKGGDPFVFARGGEEAMALGEAGVPFEVVPGVTSAVAVPAYAGVPLTYRGLSTSFTVVTGHEDPWAATETDWEAVARVGGTIVVLMGVATRGAIAERLMAGGLDSSTPVVAVTWGTRPEQLTVRCTLAELAAVDVVAPATIVIGAVAALDVAWFERRPLLGRRVVVTRAETQAAPLVSRLRELGAEVVVVPVIAIEAPADGGMALAAAADRAAAYDWVVFTSSNAVERFMPLLRDARGFGTAKVASVGPGTAAALTRWHVTADLVPERSVAEGLVESFPPGPGRALFPRAAVTRDVVAAGLRAKGYEVDEVDAYRTVRMTASSEQLAAAASADAIAFTSASTVAAYLDAGGAAAVPAIVACIGPVTAAAARDLGVTVTVEAVDHSIDGLVAALTTALARPS